MVDFVSISKFSKVGRLVPTNVAFEIEQAKQEVIEPILQAAGKAEVHWIEGNHEFRLTRYIAVMAKPLEGLIDVADALGCKEYGITYHPSKAGNGIWKITDKLTLMHGERHGLNPAKAQYDKWGGSLVMGHAHKEATWRWKHGCGADHVALAAGCLCQDPDWSDVDNYTRGFIAGWIDDETGEFGLDHVRISGDNHTEIYSPWGSYYATYRKAPNKQGTWTAKRIGRGKGSAE